MIEIAIDFKEIEDFLTSYSTQPSFPGVVQPVYQRRRQGFGWKKIEFKGGKILKPGDTVLASNCPINWTCRAAAASFNGFEVVVGGYSGFNDGSDLNIIDPAHRGNVVFAKDQIVLEDLSIRFH